MLKGYDENGNLRNVKVTEKGEILMKVAGSGDEGLNVNISNADKLATKETTLYAGVANIGVNEITIGVSEKVSEISIANYSETASVSMSVDNKNFVIAPGMALDLPINKVVSIVGLSATEEDTKVQYVLKGFASDSAKYFLPDWSEIGYDNTPENIIEDFGYSKQIYDNWDTSVTNLQGKLYGDINIKYMPLVDTSNATSMRTFLSSCINLLSIPHLITSNVENMSMMCNGSSNLVNIELLNTNKVTTMKFAFSRCTNLSNKSLNNILAMCANVSSNYSEEKTLKDIGLTSAQATTCETLSNWEAFVEAGWSTGY